MSRSDERFHPDPAVNDQLNVIREVVATGLGDAKVVTELERCGVVHLGKDGRGSSELIAQIRMAFGFR